MVACSAPSAPTPCACPTGATGCVPISPPPPRRCPHEAARLRRRRLHRLELRPPARDASTATRSSSSTSSPTPAARRTSRTSTDAELRPRGHRGRRRRRARRSTASTRSSTSPPRRTSTARSPSPTRSSRRTRSAPGCCSRPPATPACATCRSPPTRSTARSTRARSPSPPRCEPSSPYSATKAGADLLVGSYFHTYGLETLICRGSNNYGPYQYPEKLIPLMVLNALHGDPLPVYGDGMQVRNWLYVEDFARGIGHVLAHGVPGEAYNVGGPDELPEHRGRQAHHRADRRRRVADRVRHRPPRPRPPLLARLREGPRAGLGGAGALRRGPRAHRRVVSRQRRDWWEPIRSGDYRAYYERQYRQDAGVGAVARRSCRVVRSAPP